MRIRRWIPVSTTALAVALGTPTTLATAAGEPTDVMPYAIEDGAYPDRANVLGLTGADLIAGDGNITFTSCSGPYQIKVWAVKLKTNESRMCFTAANTGYLKVNIPRAYRIETVGRDIKAGISIAGTTENLTVGRDTSKGFGEADLSDPKQAVLLEMRVTGSSSPAPQGPAEGNPLSFTGKLNIGDTRACTAALIDPRWVVTAKSCFADNPAENNTIPAGAPKDKTTLTLGRADLTSTGGHTTDIVELAPHADRDLVLARLAAPATGVPPPSPCRPPRPRRARTSRSPATAAPATTGFPPSFTRRPIPPAPRTQRASTSPPRPPRTPACARATPALPSCAPRTASPPSPPSPAAPGRTTATEAPKPKQVPTPPASTTSASGSTITPAWRQQPSVCTVRPILRSTSRTGTGTSRDGRSSVLRAICH